MKTISFVFAVLSFFMVVAATNEQRQESLSVVGFEGTGNPPGFRTTVSQLGLDYGSVIAATIIAAELHDVPLPDAEGQADTPVGHITYHITDLNIRSISLGGSRIVSQHDTGLRYVLSGASAGLTTSWSYRKNSWPHVKDHGTADVTASNLNGAVDIVVTADDDGKPVAAVTHVELGIGDLDLKVHGGLSWMYNLLLKIFKGSIKKTIENELRSQLGSIIEDAAAEGLKDLPVIVPVMEGMMDIYFGMCDDPTYGDDYLALNHDGAFHKGGDPTRPPGQPSELPDMTTPDGMLLLTVTDWMLNSATWVLQESGLFKYHIDADDVPAKSPLKLNTKFFKNFAPGLYDLFPDTDMSIDLASDHEPHVGIDAGGLNADDISGLIDFYVVVDGKQRPVFTLGAEVTAHALVSLDGTAIVGKVDDLVVVTHQVETSVGNIDCEGFDKTLKFAMDAGVLPWINSQLEEGIPIPMVDGISIEDAHTEYGEGYLSVVTDVVYNPEFVRQARAKLENRAIDLGLKFLAMQKDGDDRM